jgi:hypothetical protein
LLSVEGSAAYFGPLDKEREVQTLSVDLSFFFANPGGMVRPSLPTEQANIGGRN